MVAVKIGVVKVLESPNNLTPPVATSYQSKTTPASAVDALKVVFCPDNIDTLCVNTVAGPGTGLEVTLTAVLAALQVPIDAST